MGKTFVLLGIFLVFIYIYSFRKIKKTKEKTKNIDSVRDFHESYGHLINKQQTQGKTDAGYYRKYVTKYNSSEDYREKL